MIRVLLVDPSRAAGASLGELLQATGELQVVGYAHSATEAVAMAQSLKPQVICASLSLSRDAGLLMTREIMGSAPTPILLLSDEGAEGAVPGAGLAREEEVEPRGHREEEDGVAEPPAEELPDARDERGGDARDERHHPAWWGRGRVRRVVMHQSVLARRDNP